MEDQSPTPPPTFNPPPSSGSSNMGMAILAYLGILIVVPFLTEAKNDPFVKFHIKQGLSLIILEVIAMFVNIVPVLGWIVGFFLWLVILIFIIMGIMNAASGKQKELPLIGGLAKNFNF